MRFITNTLAHSSREAFIIKILDTQTAALHACIMDAQGNITRENLTLTEISSMHGWTLVDKSTLPTPVITAVKTLIHHIKRDTN